MDARITAIAAAAMLAAAGYTHPAHGPAPTPEDQARMAAHKPKGFPKPGNIPQSELTCLALNVYWESRGEPEDGREAVANVTLNRVEAQSFPSTICGVVTQGGTTGPCQFEWYCDGKPDVPTEPTAWLDAQMIAYKAIVERRDPTGGALYFHHVSLAPTWARARLNTKVIGQHVFFRLQGGELGERQLAQVVIP